MRYDRLYADLNQSRTVRPGMGVTAIDRQMVQATGDLHHDVRNIVDGHP